MKMYGPLPVVWQKLSCFGGDPADGSPTATLL